MSGYGDEELLRIVKKYAKNCRFVLSQSDCIERILDTGTSFQKMNARATRMGVCHSLVIDWIARKKIGAPTHSRLYNNNKAFYGYISTQVFTMFAKHYHPEGIGVTARTIGLAERKIAGGDPCVRGRPAAGLVMAGACVKNKASLEHDLGRLSFKKDAGHTVGFQFGSGTKATWFDPNCGEFEFPNYKEFQDFFVDMFDNSSYSALDGSFLIHTYGGFPTNVKELWQTSLGHSVL